MARQRSGLLTTNFAEGGGFIRSAPNEPIPDLQLHFVIGKLVDHGRKTDARPWLLVPRLPAASRRAAAR
jgi:choline dehydrogenase-like flavoprotein